MASALSNLIVLDFTRIVSGSLTTLLMAELGAEIIKVEFREGGDASRQIPPFNEGGEGWIFTNLNRGKKGITLDTTKEEGRKIAFELMAKADVVVENFSPGVMKTLGLDYESAIKVKPDIVYASISGFGQTGPYASRVSFDIVAQAMGGLMSVTGFPENPPTKAGPCIADQTAGLYALIGILAALRHRDATGEGQYIDISLQDCVFWMSSMEFIGMYWSKKVLPRLMGNKHEVLVPWDLFKTKDGHAIIGCVNNGHWQKLAETMGRADMVPTPETTTLVYRIEHRDEINKTVAEWAVGLTTAELQKKLDEAGLACAPVLNLAQLVDDPQIRHRDMIVEVEQTISGKMKTLGSVLKMSKTPGNPVQRAPFLGESNAEVYGKLMGYSETKINELANKKII
ncbi:MAG: CaiB/BaiF CoA transferase family protein [Smithellaceae bacterium]